MTRSGWTAWAAAAGAAAAFLLLPLVTFGVAVLRNEGGVRLSALVAEEELRGALRDGSVRGAWDAAVVYVNFTRGALEAQVYRLTVGQFVLSTALGALVGLNLAAVRRLQVGGVAAMGSGVGAGGGAAATLCAATAGALGCCGGGATGGLVAALGLSFPVAAILGETAWIVQVGAIAFLAAGLVRARRRLAASSTPRRRA